MNRTGGPRPIILATREAGEEDHKANLVGPCLQIKSKQLGVWLRRRALAQQAHSCVRPPALQSPIKRHCGVTELWLTHHIPLPWWLGRWTPDWPITSPLPTVRYGWTGERPLRECALMWMLPLGYIFLPVSPQSSSPSHTLRLSHGGDSALTDHGGTTRWKNYGSFCKEVWQGTSRPGGLTLDNPIRKKWSS